MQRYRFFLVGGCQIYSILLRPFRLSFGFDFHCLPFAWSGCLAWGSRLYILYFHCSSILSVQTALNSYQLYAAQNLHTNGVICIYTHTTVWSSLSVNSIAHIEMSLWPQQSQTFDIYKYDSTMKNMLWYTCTPLPVRPVPPWTVAKV